MARILIFREDPGPLKPLRKALQAHHELVFAEKLPEAMQILRDNSFDLIICRVHMDTANIFDFIKALREDEALAAIPFVCLSSERSQLSKFLDTNLEHAALICGADRYLVLNQFCTGDTCDFEALRKAIEDVLVADERPDINIYSQHEDGPADAPPQ